MFERQRPSNRRRGGLPLLAVILMANAVFCSECLLEDAQLYRPGPDPASSMGVTRIFGGNEVTPGEFPFLVSIDDRCVGSIIGPHHILTSADCVDHYYSLENDWYQKPLETMKVFAGEHNRYVDDGEFKVEVLGLKIHPNYGRDGPTWRKDNIALLKTREELYAETAIDGASTASSVPRAVGASRAISLRSEPVEDGADLTVIGWGADRYSDGRPIKSPVPMKLRVKKLSNSRCKCYLDSHDIELVDGTMCAATERHLGALCDGDSGSPLVLKTKDAKYELVGVASVFERPCKTSKVPAVYTEVSQYKDWILANQK